jgi:hypothetical protein
MPFGMKAVEAYGATDGRILVLNPESPMPFGMKAVEASLFITH